MPLRIAGGSDGRIFEKNNRVSLRYVAFGQANSPAFRLRGRRITHQNITTQITQKNTESVLVKHFLRFINSEPLTDTAQIEPHTGFL